MFDTEIATRYGVNAAILFQNIAFWCDHSRANGTNYYDGLYWTYNSVKAFEDLFPYLGKKQISNALQKLMDEGLIVKGNYNKVSYDRTSWYALTETGSILFRKTENASIQNGTFDLPKRGNGNSQKGKPIPDINTDSKQDISISRNGAESEIPQGFDDFWSVYPRKVARKAALTAWKKVKPGEVDAILADVQRRAQGEWKDKDVQYIPHPATYINQRRWEDEPAKVEEIQRDENMEDFYRRNGY